MFQTFENLNLGIVSNFGFRIFKFKRMTKKLFMIACEPSGDTHGAALIRELKKISPGLQIKGLGGPRMAEAGAELLFDMTTLSALGLGDVIRLYFRYRKIFYQALREVESLKPDAIIAIDSPAFNLRFAKKIKKRFPFIYYISPQIWAWGEQRIHVIRKNISLMLSILPFEKKLYDQEGVPCEFVGHPLLDHLGPTKSRAEARLPWKLSDKDIALGLFAGSRKKEVERIFPLMLETARQIKKMLPGALFFSPLSRNVSRKVYDTILKKFEDVPVRLVENTLPDLAPALDFALVTSGTATLETALLGTPYFLLYKASRSTYWLGKHLIRVPYLGLVNLLAGKSVVPEFIQNDIKPDHIADEVHHILKHPELMEVMRSDFDRVREKLGRSGASERAAKIILAEIKKSV